MPGITGIQPLNGMYAWSDPSADPFTLQGGPANPKHGQPLADPNQPYPWQAQGWPQAQSNMPSGEWIDDYQCYPSAGMGTPDTPYFDATPNTHAGPWPKGVPTTVRPDEVAERRIESMVLHGDGMDNAKPSLIISALQDIWQRIWNPDDKTPNIQETVNNQVKHSVGGYGSTDAVGNPDGHNEYDYGNAHMMRRWGAGSVPGAYMWMKPGGRPLVGFVPGPARPPVGTGPFEGQDIGQGFSAYPGVLTQPAGAYEVPPDPYQPTALSQQSLIEAPLVG